MPKIIGIDYGAKRVGIAVSDEASSIAFPHATFANDRALMDTLLTLIRTTNASTVVIGDSQDANGNDNPIMKDARAFAEDLQKRAAVAVAYEPEFYTSQEARQHTGKFAVDAEAAAIMLNSYLAKRVRL